MSTPENNQISTATAQTTLPSNVRYEAIPSNAEALKAVFDFMVQNQVQVVTLTRSGGGDSGDMAEFSYELKDENCSEELREKTQEQFEEIDSHLDALIDSYEDRSDADYNNDGGEFCATLTLTDNEEGTHTLISEGYFNSYYNNDENQLDRSLPKEQLADFLKDILNEDDSRKLIKLLTEHNEPFEIQYTGSGDSGDGYNILDGNLEGFIERELTTLFDRMIDAIGSGTFNDDGGGFSFKLDEDGNFCVQHWYCVVHSDPIGRYEDKFKLIGGDLVQMIEHENDLPSPEQPPLLPGA